MQIRNIIQGNRVCETFTVMKASVLKISITLCTYSIYLFQKCHTCKLKIAAGDQRVGWKDLSWHLSPDCFCCFQCSKSLLGGKFLVKN